MSLLLGLPYLPAVNAVIAIAPETIQIGDPERGEQVVIVSSPTKPSARPKVQNTLPPKPRIKEVNKDQDDKIGSGSSGTTPATATDIDLEFRQDPSKTEKACLSNKRNSNISAAVTAETTLQP